MEQAAQNSETAENQELWSPSTTQIDNTHIRAFANDVTAKHGTRFADYTSLWQWSIDNIPDFWSAVWDDCGVIGDKGETILNRPDKMPGAEFFPEARLNYAENMLKKRDDTAAIIFRNEKGSERTLTFNELYDAVSKLAQFLEHQGVGEGDRVAGYLPNMPEAIIGALAANSLGAIWSSASPDFGVKGVVDRFGQIDPKILITVDGYFYNGKTINCLEKIQEIQPSLPSLTHTLVIPFAHERPDLSSLSSASNYNEVMAKIKAKDMAFKRLPFNHPLFIMFSSGTTGKPKSIVHGQGGTLIQHLKEHQLQCDIREGDRFFQFTTTGWMMWNWLITGLASGATLLLYDGSPFYPEPLSLWEYADTHEAKLFGTGAKYIDALRNDGQCPKDAYKLEKLKILTSTGSPLVHEAFDYIYSDIKTDMHVASISGGTDIISCFVLGNPMSPVYRGEIQGPGLGMAVDVFNDNGMPIPAGAGSGELVCTKPFPSMPIYFWNDKDNAKFKSAYFEAFDNIWAHGDWIERTPHNGYIIHGRSDATLNPGGVRIGTAEIYRQVEQIEEIKEAIAVGQSWEGDDRVVLFVVMNGGYDLNDDVMKRIKKQIRTGASPRHVPAKIIPIQDIPRTKSGKIVELAVRHVIHGRPVKNIEALANPQALDLYKNIPALNE